MPPRRRRGIGATNPDSQSWMAQTGSRLTSIQVLRACAAFLAVTWHFRDILKNFPEIQFQLPYMLRMGYAGVDLFFSIGGFIICHVAYRGEFRASEFGLKRFFRIGPFYFPFPSIQ